jgi:hypothetical protein
MSPSIRIAEIPLFVGLLLPLLAVRARLGIDSEFASLTPDDDNDIESPRLNGNVLRGVASGSGRGRLEGEPSSTVIGGDKRRFAGCLYEMSSRASFFELGSGGGDGSVGKES